jgi:hypothetical protein
MSVATALIFALSREAVSRRVSGHFSPFPSPTKTIAPVIQSMTMVKNLFSSQRRFHQWQ